MTEDDEKTPYAQLGPDQILDAVEGAGYPCDGHLLALNSYENRVYQVGLDGAVPVVVKFYRPGRWSDDAILEEHRFTLELAELEIPVVAPIVDPEGVTLHRHGPFRFALYPRRGGRAPDLEDPGQLEQLGRFVARIHGLGAVQPYRHRPSVDVENFGVESYQYLLESGFIPHDLELAYRSLAEDLIVRIRACYARAGAVARIRLHGDCHPGNILWTDDGPHIVDFDDARTGPAVQDLWMFLSGDRAFMTARLADLMEGYTEFHSFDPRELHLIEALRTLRMLHYAAWIGRRWDDPAFPRAFPWFAGGRYWEEHILSLREQAALMDEPPPVWS
ncbi:MAG: stress response serine/threonine protein kinase YihE [Chromatiales bacterium 21-64-14]|nr:MAG: stress response serine/threonine protein kinase YihE [Chromatiales bacterium 21-64-14]HQU15833.1 serine/threonine protein kinase [Gammaproteobacteria bacterium]